MIKKTLIILSILAIAVIAGAFAVYAYTTWNQTVTWTDEDLNFNVYTVSTGGSPIVVPSTLSLIVSPTSTVTVNYYIQNDGNVPITVTGSASPNSGTVTDNWSPSYVDVAVGTSRELITLTLSGFSIGGGSITVSFASVATP